MESLGIQSGKVQVPPMLWFADKENLFVFALATDRRPTEKTPLYYAPFFNVYEDGAVCMGTVSIDIKNSVSVEEFIQVWEDYFFNSYFSHLLDSYNPIKGNLSRKFIKELLSFIFGYSSKFDLGRLMVCRAIFEERSVLECNSF